MELCYRQAERALQRTFPRPEVRFDQRGQAAGSAYPSHNRLRFNPELLHRQPEEFIAEVVPHEVAHLVVWHCYGRVRPHGPQWQAVMEQVLGVPARRTHSFEVTPTRRIKRFAYRCDCQLHQLTSIRHRRVLAGQRYLCRHCGQALRPGIAASAAG